MIRHVRALYVSRVENQSVQVGQDIVGPGERHWGQGTLGQFDEVDVGSVAVDHREARAHFTRGAPKTNAGVETGVGSKQLITVGPTTGGVSGSAGYVRSRGNTASPRVVVHPDVIRGEDRKAAGPGAAKTGRSLGVVAHWEPSGDGGVVVGSGGMLRVSGECTVDPNVGRETPSGAFEVGDNEELLSGGQAVPIVRQHHWANTLGGACAIDRLENVVGARGTVGESGPRKCGCGSGDARIVTPPDAIGEGAVTGLKKIRIRCNIGAGVGD